MEFKKPNLSELEKLTPKLMGKIDLDTGSIWFGDPCHILHANERMPKSVGNDWSGFVNQLGRNAYKSFDFEGEAEGVGVCARVDGDGTYAVIGYFRDNNVMPSYVVIDFDNQSPHLDLYEDIEVEDDKDVQELVIYPLEHFYDEAENQYVLFVYYDDNKHGKIAFTHNDVKNKIDFKTSGLRKDSINMKYDRFTQNKLTVNFNYKGAYDAVTIEFNTDTGVWTFNYCNLH